jgi:hypothetical protein
VEHKDLFEDVLLAIVVATATVATLFVGWEAGRARRRSRDRDQPAGDPVPEAGGPVGPGFRREPIGSWTRRLAAEQARAARHGGSATVVVMDHGTTHGALGRRVTPELSRIVGVADVVARQTRASDYVRVTDDGIIRILLVETNEAGAQVFVDRISARLAADADTSQDLVTAWASVPSGRDLSAADRLAVARLRGATSGWLRSRSVRRPIGAPALAVAAVEIDTDVAGPEGSTG